MIRAEFAAVLAAAQRGDDAAFTRIFRDAQPPLLRYLRVIDPARAEDVAADTWDRVAARLGRFSGDERAFREWLFTIARRGVAGQGRPRTRRRTTPRHRSGAEDPLTLPDATDAVLERLGTQAALAAVAELTPDEAEIIMLRMVAGLDTQQVARLVGKSPGEVRAAAHRALRRLARRPQPPRDGSTECQARPA